MAGRAGRRGADKKGTVISLVDFSNLTRTPLPDWEKADLEAIRSRIQFSFNMVANLAARLTDNQVKELCNRTLATYQEAGQQLSGDTLPAAERLYQQYCEKKDVLHALGYMEDNRLLPKGEALRAVYVKELLVTELLFSELITSLPAPHLAGLAAALTYSGRVMEGFPLRAQPWMAEVGMVIERLKRQAGSNLGSQVELFSPVAGVVSQWAAGGDLLDVVQGVPMQAGDLVTLCRQVIDLLRQMANARPHDRPLVDLIQQTVAAVDRDVVEVHL